MADRTITYRLSADITNLKAQMAQAAASVKGAADKMTAATKEGDKFRRGLDTVGSTAGRVGLVAAAGLGAAVAAAANFDQAMSSVQAATHESAANMDLLREAAIQAGADTSFSAMEAAAGIENLAKAGVSTRDILGGGLSGALDLAAAGSISVSEAAETAATALTQFGLSGQDVPHVADLLAAGAGKAQGEVSDLGMALNQSGLVAAQMGLSIEETTGSLAAFASAGLLGSDAGTSFKNMLLRLANPSKEAAATMERFGIAAYDAQGNMVSMPELAQQLKVAFQGQSQATRDAALATIFGSDAIRAANVLYTQGADGIEDWTAKVDDTGYAAETAATRLDNLRGDLEQLGGSLQTALIGTGEGAQGPLRSLVQSLTDVVNAYNKLPDPAHDATAAMLGITAVLGGGLWFTSKVVSGIAATRVALVELGVTAQTTSGLLAGVGAAAAAITAGVGIAMFIDSMDDANLSAEQLNDGLKALALGETTYEFEHLTSTVDDLGDAISQAAYDDLHLIDAADDIKTIDAQLVAFAEKSPRMAAKAFDSIIAKGRAAGVAYEDILKVFPQYQAWLQRTADAEARASASKLAKHLWDTRDAMGHLPPLAETASGAIDDVGTSLGNAADEALTFKGALEALNGFLDKRAALRNYEASLDDLTAGLKENGKSFDENTEKGRKNQDNLDAFVKNAAIYAQKLKGAARIDFLQDSVQHIRDIAKAWHLPASAVQGVIDKMNVAIGAQMGMTKAQTDLIRQYHLTPKQVSTLIEQVDMGKSKGDIKDLLTQYGLTPREIKTLVKALTADANTGINGVRNNLNNLNGQSATVTLYHRTINEIVNTISGTNNGVPDSLKKAQGGYIAGPGTATSDSIPAMLSNGEYVMKAAAVDKYGVGFMHQLNTMQYAAGGLVGKMNAAASRMGAQVQWFANGGYATPSAPVSVSASASLAEREMVAFAKTVAPYLAAAVHQGVADRDAASQKAFRSEMRIYG